MPTTMPARAFGIRWSPRRVAGACGALAAALLLIVTFLTPLPAALLRTAGLAYLERQHGIVGTVGRLEFDVARLRVAVYDLRLAARGHRERPFLRAGEARVDFPLGAFWNGLEVEELVLRRVAVAVMRGEDDSSNLPGRRAAAPPAVVDGAGRPPTAGDAGAQSLQALEIGVLDVTGLTVDWRDDRYGFSAHLPPTAVSLFPRGGVSSGSLAMDGVARASWRGRSMQFDRFSGDIEFDGSAVGLRGVALSGPDIALALDGRVDTILAAPRLALTYTADADLARLAALLSALPVTGRLAGTGELTGTLDRLELSSVLAGAGIEMNGMPAERVDAALRLTGTDIALEQLRLELAGGSLSASGRVGRGPDWPGQLDIAWSGLDADRLLSTIWAYPPLLLQAAADGSLAARWPALDPQSVAASGEARLLGNGAGGAGLRIAAGDGRWRVTVDQTLAGAVSISGAAEAVLPPAGVGSSRWIDAPLTGELVVECSDLGNCGRLLTAADPTEASPSLAGAAGARFNVGGSLVRPVASGRLEAPELVAGPVALRGLEARLHADPDEIRADDIRMRAGPNTATGRLRVSLPRGALEGAFTASVFDLAAPEPLAPPGWAPAGRGELAATIGGTIQQVEASASYRFDAVHVAGRDLGSVVGTAALVAGEDWRADLRVPALGATVEASLHGPADERRFRLHGLAIDADIARLAPPAVPLTGRVTLAAAAEGPLGNLAASELELQIDAAAGSVRGFAASLSRPAVVRFGAAGLRAEDLELAFGRSRLHVDGGLRPGADDALTLRLSGAIGDIGTVAAALGVPPPGTLDGNIALELAAAGAPGAFELTGGLRIDNGAFALAGYPALGGVTARAALDDGMLRIESLRADWAGAAIDGSAEVPLALGLSWLGGASAVPVTELRRPAAARFEVTALTPEVLNGILDTAWRDQLAGSANATIELELPAPYIADARGRLMLSDASLVVAGIPLAQQRPTEIVLEDGRAHFRSFDWGNATNNVVVGGHLQLAADAGADLSVTANLDLRALNAFVPALGALGAAADGSATVNARLAGSLARPAVSGRVDLAGGELHLDEPRLALADIDGALLLAGNRLTAAGLTGNANGGRVEIRGGWSFAGAAGPNGFTLTGDGLALEIPRGLRSEADVDLRLAAENGGLALTGTVDLLRAAYREPFVLSGGLFELLGREPGVATIDTEDRTDLDVRLDLQVTTADDIVVANNYVDAELGADLRVGGTLRAPSATGRAALRQGGQVRFGSRVYEIDTGAVDFIDPAGIVPALALEAHTRAGGYDITLEASGTGNDLSTSLRSEPPLPESDIASVLLTGRPLDQAAAGFAADAREQALGLMSSELLAQVGRGLGVDLRIGADGPASGSDVLFDPSLIANDLNPASRLTVGRDLRDNVRLVFSRGLRDDDMAWLVDYLPRNNVELRALFDDERRRAYEFRHVVTAGGSARGTASRGRARARPEVTAVEVRGAPGVDTVALRDLLMIEAGDTFDFRRWQDDRQRVAGRLHAQGFLEARVRARRVPGPDERTVGLTYEIERGPRTQLTVTGYSIPDAVRRDLEAIWTSAVFDTFLTAELAARVDAHLADEGYLRAAVNVQIAGNAGAAIETAPRVKEITIGIDPGRRTNERRLAFEGIPAEEERALRALAAAWNLDAVAWTDPEPLVTAVRNWYRNQGRLRATVEAGEVRFADGAAELPVRVAAGPLYRVGRVRISGTRKRTEAAAREAAAIVAGDAYSEPAIVEARRRIEASYRQAGHAEARVSAESVVNDETRTIEVRLSVVEGPQQILDEVVVEGAERTHPALIARALDLQPGAAVDPLAWNLARRRLYQTGVFRSVDIVAREQPTPASGDGSTPVEARVTLEEWPPYRLRYGLRVADEAAALGETTGRTLRVGAGGDLTRRNLFGRGLTAGVSVLADGGHQAVRAYLTVPTLFGRAMETNLFAARRRAQTGPEAAGLVTNVTTFTAEQRMRPHADLTVAYSANLDLYDALDPAARRQILARSRGKVVRFDASTVADSRDDLFDASAGLFHSSNVEYGSLLGRPWRYLKYLGQQFAYRRLGRVVLASAARIGLATGFGSPLLPTERFFAGGGNTVRGYRQDSLGPRHAGGTPLGGNALLILNQEVRFPLPWRLSGVGFVDAGNAFASASDIALRELRVGTGFGLRFDSPLGPLRADYGIPFRRGAGGARGRLFISLGQAF